MHRNVGLDQAHDALRVATLQSGFRGFAIQEVRSVPLPAEGTSAERLQAALAALELSPPLGPDDSVAVALPDALVATYLLTIPFADPKRIERVLPAEVEGAIPFDLSDVVWDWTILGQAGGKSEVLIGVVQKKVLRDHLDVLAASGLDPRVVTLAPLALAALGERGVLVPDGAPPPCWRQDPIAPTSPCSMPGVPSSRARWRRRMRSPGLPLSPIPPPGRACFPR